MSTWSPWKPELRPTNRINAVLSGKVRLEDEDVAIQSACSFHIYEGAKELLSISGRENRVAALKKIPELIRPHVKAEAERIYRMKKCRGF